ncbi:MULTISPECIES: ArsR/SmtB family transcription factor [Halorussus]|uniref:ArsR/SmtB family transcription factor n=1 Tax=Halorussus TaxID=1070314 RepID=UPI00209D8973|nr:helix-turn-helix domain-containing protein [Halorussus vallis]USZ73930.1 helix-turn-helix domain-containing protein [Halorussus vallis]
MSDELDVTASEGLDPDDAFTLLADETRLKILRALGDAAEPEDSNALSFSELRRRADVAQSGRFNYHLKRLTGHFVEGVEDGYRLRFPGVLVYQSIRAGTFTEDVSVAPFDLDAGCHVCDGTLRGRYDGLVFRIDCGDCETEFYHCHLPPSSLDPARREETLRAADQRIRDHLSSLSNRICPRCAGRVPPELMVPSEDHRYGDPAATSALTLYECDHCGAYNYTRVGAHLLFEPAVVSFCYQRGVDLSTRRVWSLEFVSADTRTEVVSEDPWRVAVEVDAGDETLRVVVDGDLNVVETTTR